ncbi:hypothetical protein B0H21DRAFT_385872 [Amylocystis lapponica]|nr:hypothetical protein B0H21DRAFT_385872 [Amylocystis lapponica]
MPLTQFLRPALALGALTRLELTALMALTVSDADMRVLASSYPLLQVLRLQFQVHTTDYANTVPTFSALLDFARRLSELRDLAVPFWLDGTALDTLMAHPDLASRALRRLNVLRGILEVAEDELAHVAECIDAAFPNLGPLCRRGKRYGLKWPQVNRTLMSLQNARREGVMSVC